MFLYTETNLGNGTNFWSRLCYFTFTSTKLAISTSPRPPSTGIVIIELLWPTDSLTAALIWERFKDSSWVSSLLLYYSDGGDLPLKLCTDFYLDKPILVRLRSRMSVLSLLTLIFSTAFASCTPSASASVESISSEVVAPLPSWTVMCL